MRSLALYSLLIAACGDKEVTKVLNEEISKNETEVVKALNDEQVQPKPEPEIIENRANCDSSYPTICLPARGPDLDCRNIKYRRFRVIGRDRHGFDRDRDGVGCEI